MNFFVTGSNGFIGYSLVQRLSAEGHQIKCLVRSPERFAALSRLPGTEPVIGDLTDIKALTEGVRGAEIVFHLAAFARPWSKDKGLPRKINVDGTRAILDASLNAGVRRFVFTSSAAVIGPSPSGEAADETTIRTIPFFNEYESTKSEAEKVVLSYAGKGLDVVIVNPSRVYGPGPENESNAVTRMLRLYARGRWRVIPGDGTRVGNYVYIGDVVNGHILAAMRGRTGERYILGGEDLTFSELFEKMALVTGKRRRMIYMPLPLMIFVARVMEFQTKVTGIPPLITAQWVKKYLSHWSLSSEHAMSELGYTFTLFAAGAAETLNWIKKNSQNE